MNQKNKIHLLSIEFGILYYHELNSAKYLHVIELTSHKFIESNFFFFFLNQHNIKSFDGKMLINFISYSSKTNEKIYSCDIHFPQFVDWYTLIVW